MNEWARAIRLAGDIVRHTLNALMTNEWTLFVPHMHHRLFFCIVTFVLVLGAKKVTEGRGFTSRELERSLRYSSQV